MEIDLILDAELLSEPHTSGANKSKGVRFIYHQKAVILLSEPTYFFKRCSVTVHAKNRFCNDEDAAICVRLLG